MYETEDINQLRIEIDLHILTTHTIRLVIQQGQYFHHQSSIVYCWKRRPSSGGSSKLTESQIGNKTRKWAKISFQCHEERRVPINNFDSTSGSMSLLMVPTICYTITLYNRAYFKEGVSRNFRDFLKWEKWLSSEARSFKDDNCLAYCLRWAEVVQYISFYEVSNGLRRRITGWFGYSPALQLFQDYETKVIIITIR